MKCIKMGKYAPCQSKNKETGIIILKSQKVELKIRSITREDEGSF